jgi:hypothetical protein
MSTSGFPEQRVVPSRILTPRGWIRGNFRPPKAANLVNYLNRSGPFVTLTDVASGPGDNTLPYLSVRRSAMTLILPVDSIPLESLPPGAQQAGKHHVYCLLAEGSVMATLDVRTQVRVSDYFMNREGFVPLRSPQVRTVPELPGGEPTAGALINAARIVGVAELSE